MAYVPCIPLTYAHVSMFCWRAATRLRSCLSCVSEKPMRYGAAVGTGLNPTAELAGTWPAVGWGGIEPETTAKRRGEKKKGMNVVQ